MSPGRSQAVLQIGDFDVNPTRVLHFGTTDAFESD